MKFAVFFAIVFFTCCIIGTGARGSCKQLCTREYNPVCGRYRRPHGKIIQCTFPNLCIFRSRRCQSRERWIGTRGACPKESAECVRVVKG